MEHARKMVLIPEDSIEKLKALSTGGGGGPGTTQQFRSLNDANNDAASISVQTSGTNLSRLDDEMVQLLNERDLSDREKWARYQQVQQRYLNFRNAKHGKRDVSGNSTEGKSGELERGIDNGTILLSVPSTFKKKIEVLMQLLDSDHIKERILWDRRGEVTIDGKVLHRSNIIDLVNDTVRYRKNTRAIGREYFSWFLRDIGVPSEIFGNTELYKIGADYNPNNTSDNSSLHLSSSEIKPRGFSTPNNKSASNSQKQTLSFHDSKHVDSDHDSFLENTVVAKGRNERFPKKSLLQQNIQKGRGWLSLI